MTELLPCPFCGGEASVKVLEYDDDCKVWGVFCESDLANEYSHGHFVDNYATEAEAIAAWNTRAVETCSVVASYSPSDINEEAEWYFAFSCGCELYWDEPEPPNYCPNCGAKLVGE